MSVLLIKVLWYRIKNRDETISGINSYQSPINITEMIDMGSSQGIEIKHNKFNFLVKNKNGMFTENGEIMFEEQDQLKFYAIYTDDGEDVTSDAWNQTSIIEPSSTYLLGTYYLIDYTETHQEKAQRIKVECIDKTYVLFSQLISFSITPSDNLNAPEAIQKIIRLATQGKDGLYVGTGTDSGTYYDVQGDLISESGEITDERSDASAFPDINVSGVFKPVYDWVRDLSQIEYTNTVAEQADALLYGRPFIFWIDEDNEFHWVFPDDVEDSTLTVGTDNIFSEKLNKRIRDTINMILFSAGDDLNGVGIYDYFYDDATDAKGLKMRYVPMTNIAKDMLEEDYGASHNPTRASGKKYQYPSSGSYPLTPSWSSTTVADDDEYNSSLRVTARLRGKAKAQTITKKLGFARWKGTIVMKGQKFTTGNLILYNNPSQGIVNQKLRIIDMKHTFTKSGWNTSLDLEQDTEIIITN